LFQSANLYDLFVLDMLVFCHSKRVILPGTEDMAGEYKSPRHHIKGAAKGFVLGSLVALAAACLVPLT
jgi:hypothetical protein